MTGAWDFELFSLSGVSVTLGSLLKLVVLLAALFWLAGWVRRLTISRVLRRTDLDLGTRQAVGAVVRYLVLLVGVAIILQNAGLDLAALGIVAGAVSVGVGFGLQNVVSNFVSGVIIMLERPIKVGDRVLLSDIEGEVREIGARRTTVVANDNIAILVPNQRFIVENVTNLMTTGSAVRLRLPVGAAPERDPDEVRRVLLDAAAQQPGVLAEPPPSVLRPTLAPGALAFELTVWHDPAHTLRQVLTSELNQRIDALLRRA